MLMITSLKTVEEEGSMSGRKENRYGSYRSEIKKKMKIQNTTEDVSQTNISKQPVLSFAYCWRTIVKDVLICFCFLTVIEAGRWISHVFWSPIQKLLFNGICIHSLTCPGKYFPQKNLYSDYWGRMACLHSGS